MAWIESHQALRSHPKTRKAARALGVPVPHLMGHLHCLWHWALDVADDGNLSKFDADDIAIGAEWDGDPQEFITALVDCGPGGSAGFLERDASYGNPDDELTGALVLHDWWQYAGKLVVRRMRDRARAAERRSNDAPTDPEPESQEGLDDNVGPSHDSPATVDRTAGKDQYQPTNQPTKTSVPSDDDTFDEFWQQYPKRNGKKLGKTKAKTKWRALSTDSRAKALAGCVAYARACNSGETIAKDPERFLTSRYFEDWAEVRDPPSPYTRLREVCIECEGRGVVLDEDDLAHDCACRHREAS